MVAVPACHVDRGQVPAAGFDPPGKGGLEKLQAPSSPLWDWLKRQAQPVRGRRATRSTWATGAPGTRLRAIILVPIVLLALAPAALVLECTV
jgi:hypothetical protein